MDLATFERRAFELWEQIPAGFREGVSRLVVEPGTFRKEEFEGGWCYGTCEPDPVMDLIPDAPVSSIIRLWYGSFVAIEAEEEEFDWEAELRETLRHELQHHLEWRAGVDDLGDHEDLEEENDRRHEGRPFTPWFHRRGVQLGAAAWLVGDELFLEQHVEDDAWERTLAAGAEVRWGHLCARVDPVPDAAAADSAMTDAAKRGTPLYLLSGWELVEEPDSNVPWLDVTVVFVRKPRSWWRRLLAWTWTPW